VGIPENFFSKPIRRLEPIERPAEEAKSSPHIVGFELVHTSSTRTGAWELKVVYHLHGKPIRFEIVRMVSKISERKSHSDYALSI
jgi:hypothetical protein